MALNKVYGKTKEAFVFIIDEWDCILRDRQYTADDQKKYLAFDSEHSEVFIPNAEIRGEFRNATQGDHWKDIVTALEQSQKLLEATWNQDGEIVAEILDAVHSENTSILTYNDENSLSCVISLAYFNAMKEYHGNLLLVGINYDKESKKHACVIEKWENFCF